MDEVWDLKAVNLAQDCQLVSRTCFSVKATRVEQLTRPPKRSVICFADSKKERIALLPLGLNKKERTQLIEDHLALNKWCASLSLSL